MPKVLSEPFSGHGIPSGEIVLEDDDGHALPMSVRALADLLRLLNGRTECVVLNACYSLEQANPLAETVNCVVGMARAIGDPSAIRFAAGFYRGLAYGKDYHTAFLMGCNEIDLLSLPDAVVPHFTTRTKDEVASQTEPARVQLKAPQRTWVVGDLRKVTKEDENAPREYPVWYGTNRELVDANDPFKGYSSRRQKDDKIHFGICNVGIPKFHKIGSLGSSWWKRWLTWTDDRLKLIELLPISSENEYWISIAKALTTRWAVGERSALVFIHGYNMTFEMAALRAAQIGFDLQVPGITAFFSWPSKGMIMGYAADEASCAASEKPMTDFLNGLVKYTGAERVHLIAHSMGNLGLLHSMQRIAKQAVQASKVPFGEIFLAAPDVDSDVFRNLSQVYTSLNVPRIAQHTTLYVSSRDKALASSGILRDYPRAGFSPPVTVLPGIDTVEVSNIDLTFLGHGYYAGARDILQDMHSLLLGNPPLPPERRFGLRPARTDDGQSYWRIGG